MSQLPRPRSTDGLSGRLPSIRRGWPVLHRSRNDTRVFDGSRQTNRSLNRLEGFPISLGAVIGDIGLEPRGGSVEPPTPLPCHRSHRAVRSRQRRDRRRDDRPNTRDLIDRLDVNARYHCVGKRGANDGEMESPGGGDVVYVPGHAGDQGRVFTTLNRRAKK